MAEKETFQTHVHGRLVGRRGQNERPPNSEAFVDEVR